MEENNNKIISFDQEDNEIDLRKFLNIFVRNKKIIFITAFLGTLLGITYTLSRKHIYIGRFQVVVDSTKEEANTNAGMPFQNLLGGNSNALKTEELILKSPFVLKPVYEYAVSEYVLRNDKEKSWSFSKWSSKKLNINFESGTNILNISFIDRDREFILSTLGKIISEYQDYSKLSRDKTLKKSFDFLTSQQIALQEKVLKSSKDLNKFTIKNRLGEFDGFVRTIPNNSFSLSKILNKNQSNNPTNNNIQNNQGIKIKANQRFEAQFKLLEEYEAKFMDYSSRLKPNSRLLKELKIKIENLKESLKRPTEILLKYRELYRIAERDETILNQVERDLALTELEIARQKDPWDMIFEPTIDDIRVSPKRTQNTLISFLVSLLFGSLLAYFKDKSTGIIFELDELKELINCEFISSIELSTKELSKKIIYKNIEDKTKENIKIALTKTYFLNTFNGIDNEKNNFANYLFDNEKNSLISLNDTSQIEEAKYLIILVNQNNIKKKDITLINKYISLFPSKVLGWYFLADN